MGLFDVIQSKLELFRLEQRYTKRRHRRSTFVSDAVYVDGEYVYATSNSTGSSSRSDQSNQSNQSEQSRSTKASKRRSVAFDEFLPREPEEAGRSSPQKDVPQNDVPQRRWSRNWGKTKREDKRRSMAPVHEMTQEDSRN